RPRLPSERNEARRPGEKLCWSLANCTRNVFASPSLANGKRGRLRSSQKENSVPRESLFIGGNHVILDLGNGRYAFDTHLQPGSLRVKVGDKVKVGQVLGLVGNSGNSTEPHLHFHLSDANSPLGSEGLPYVFASFEVQGKGGNWKAADKDVVEKHEMEIPMQNEVVRFPGGR
ncbi:MAG: M23 family metallopeptidase, partial [Blastocatellia bacterium]|nr:M23 family metallopeptidase [Blastocatellia bacterium]